MRLTEKFRLLDAALVLSLVALAVSDSEGVALLAVIAFVAIAAHRSLNPLPPTRNREASPDNAPSSE